MKYMKKKEKSKSRLLSVIICVAALLLIGEICLLLFMERNPNDAAGKDGSLPAGESAEPSDQTTVPTTLEAQHSGKETLPAEAEYKELEVVSDFGTFLLSGYWHGQMRAQITENEVYTISVFGQAGAQQEQHLFDVHFGGKGGEILGYVAGEDGRHLAVSVEISDFTPDSSWKEFEKQEFYGMQNEVNSILGQLVWLSEDEMATTDVGGNSEDLLIETAYMTLRYPEEWKDQTRIEISGDDVVTVSFYGTPSGMDECHLFDVILAGTGENIVGVFTTEDGSEIYVEIANVADGPDDTWEEAAAIDMTAMIDSVNYILIALEQSGNFSFI